MSDPFSFRFDDDPPAHEPVETFRADLPKPKQKKRRGGDGGDYRRPPRIWPFLRGLIWFALTLVLVAGAAGAWGYFNYVRGLPDVPEQGALYSVNAAPGIRFVDRAGVTIATRGPKHGQRVVLRQLPPHVAKAFLAAEDRRFYEHGPVDWRGAARAAKTNLNAGKVVEGGSTLSQQLARTLFLKPERSWKRKVQEAAMAYRLERRLSKDAILELYLNRVFFGANAYGIDAAARTYFGKPATALTLQEAALLAALPKAPSRLSPARDMPAALARQRLVLDRMQAEGWITPTQHQAALAAPPVLVPEAPEDQDFGWALDMAQAEAAKLVKGRAGDLVVRLSIDSALQKTAAKLIRDSLTPAARRAGAEEAALVAIAPDGGVRAMVGGRDHRFSAFNRAVQAQRQPGSAFKPFVFAAALEAGVRPTDVRDDAPVRLGPWTPGNYGGRFLGPVTVEEALVRSLNTVSVRLAREAGDNRVASLASRFGLASIPANAGLSIALGAYEVNLLELVSGYQVFQNQGRRVAPALIEDIATSGGVSLYRRPVSLGLQVYDPARAGEMVRMMKAVVTRGTGKRAGFGRPAAGKTGTSQDWRDAWFVGFTPDWIAGVWVGADDNTSMRKVTGGDLPAEIWRKFMAAAHQGIPVRDFAWLGGAEGQTPTAEASDTPPSAAPSTEERDSFYQTLQSEFARAEAEASIPPP
ncbi:MAG: transglycosylase domain-containing protein [Caulobacteraceae bacterium]